MTAVDRLTYRVTAHSVDRHHSIAQTKEAEIGLDTDLAGQAELFNPVELLLAAMAACMLKGIARVASMLEFALRGARIELSAIRQNSPPRITRIDYVLTIDSDEPDHRLELLHKNIRKYGTISNTLAGSTVVEGHIARQA